MGHDIYELWTARPYRPSSVPAFSWSVDELSLRRWQHLIDLGFDVNFHDPVRGLGPVLGDVVAMQEATTAHVQFLLDHGAVVTTRMVKTARRPEIREQLEQWLKDHDETPVPHNERFPVRERPWHS